jgi:diaminopimelate decarboxylase
MKSPGIRRPFERSARIAAKRVVAGVARRLVPGREDLPMETWGLSRDAAGVLRLGAIDLRDLLGRRGSPLHVVDAQALARNAARFTAHPPGTRRACEVFCSYKTNPVPGILRALHAQGLGAEVVSGYELWLALRLGVAPEAIVYNGPGKSDESFVTALDAGIGLINLNSRSELARLASLARRLGRRPTVGIRVVVPGGVGEQLGERIDTGAALRAFEEALRLPELHVVALHAHFNGALVSRPQLDAFVEALLSFAEELRARLGLTVQILDVGGNLTCPTVSPLSWQARRLATTLGIEPRPRAPRSVLAIDEYVACVVQRVESHCAEHNWPTPRIFVEPGRALTGNTQMLLCSVVDTRDPDELGIRRVVLDVGMHLAEPLTNELHQIFPIYPRPGAPSAIHRLTGPSCMVADQVVPAWRLAELSPGDGLAIMDAGAYVVAFSAPFSFPRPAVVMVDGAREQPLRAAETFEDLVALDGEWGAIGRVYSNGRGATDHAGVRASRAR